jgi:hypothetical protein
MEAELAINALLMAVGEDSLVNKSSFIQIKAVNSIVMRGRIF